MVTKTVKETEAELAYVVDRLTRLDLSDDERECLFEYKYDLTQDLVEMSKNV